MTSGSREVGADRDYFGTESESKIRVVSCTQTSDHCNFADRLVTLISRLECNYEGEDELLWFNFLKLVKKQLKSNPHNIVQELKIWLRDEERNDQDEDNFNDFLLEYYSSLKMKTRMA